MAMKKVSIIMPVYNCEHYLTESLDSVLKQTLQEWELLCIDDGSSDNSLKILKEYETNDSRIIVFSQTNKGAGQARNFGIQHACGEYIAFLDADDYFFDASALEEMYQTCIQNRVNACGSTIRLHRNGVIAEDVGFNDIKRDFADNKILHYDKYQFDYGYYGFIFKTRKLREYNIFFPPYRRFQDPPFFVKAMYHIQDFCFVDKSLYCYRTPNVTARLSVEKTVDLLNGLLDNLGFAADNHLWILFERTIQRIEVEYQDFILQNINSESVEILKLLLKANDLVRERDHRVNYVLAPLKKILESVSETEMNHRVELSKKIKACKRILLYGAGTAASDCLSALQKEGMLERVSAIIVTSLQGNPIQIKGIPVMSVDDYHHKVGDFVLITVTNLNCKDIICKLQEMQVQDYEVINSGMLTNV